MAPQMAGVVNRVIYRMAADVGEHVGLDSRLSEVLGVSLSLCSWLQYFHGFPSERWATPSLMDQ